LLALTAICVGLWIVIPWNAHSLPPAHLNAGPEGISHAEPGLWGKLSREISAHAFEMVLYPLTLVTLALWESRRGHLGRRLAFLGNMTYSLYLLHFPLQFVFMSMCLRAGWGVSVFYSPWTMLLFMATLAPLSMACYHFFERPWQRRIRGWLEQKAVPARTAPSLGGERPEMAQIPIPIGEERDLAGDRN
jgi:peptidoglycan/LPS O-acetylase OafA/YrhL